MNSEQLLNSRHSPSYKLIIFDWDGTLMDSQARIINCLDAVSKEMRLNPLSEQQYKNIIGLGLTEAAISLFPDLLPDQINYFAERYRYHYITLNDTPSGLFSDVRNMLTQLSRQGFMLAIATGKGRQGLDHVLQETGLTDVFHASRCADETRSKPHPQMLEELLYEFALTADEAIMVGDTEYDMIMAATLNMDSLAVSYGVHEKSRLLTHKPLTCVDSIQEMSAWFSQCYSSW